MNFKEIQEIIRMVNKSNLAEIKIKDGEFELTIRTDEYHKTRVQIPTQQLISVPTSAIPQTSFASTPSPVPFAQVAPTTSELIPLAAKKESGSNYVEIKSPMVGTYYSSPSPDKGAYVKVGDIIKVGDVVCIIEAMKLFNEIESEISGKVVKILLQDSSPVEYDQPLFLLEPN